MSDRITEAREAADALEAEWRGAEHVSEVEMRAVAALRALIEPPTAECDHDWRNRVGGGSLCSKCNIWQDKRVATPNLPTDDEREALDKAIWWAVLEECCAHKGGEPHATDWNRDGYRRVATLCERCARLIETLKALPGFRRQGPVTDAAKSTQEES